MKLIKINTDHYVVVDDSKIQEGDWVLTNISEIEVYNQIEQFKGKCDSVYCKKITHSTTTANLDVYSQTPIGLSLSEVKELIGEVNVEKKAESYAKDGLVLDTPYANGLFYGYIKGYTQALEDNKEKKYTEEDIRKAIAVGYDWCHQKHMPQDCMIDNFIQSLQPKTEWEVEIVDGKLKLK